MIWLVSPEVSESANLGGSGGSGVTLKDEGTSLGSKTDLNFTGAAVVCTSTSPTVGTCDITQAAAPAAAYYLAPHTWAAIEGKGAMDDDPYRFSPGQYVKRLAKFGGSLAFDGVNDYASDASPTITVFTGWTVSMWIYLTVDDTNQDIIAIGNLSTANSASFYTRVNASNKFEAAVASGSSLSSCTSTSSILTDRWTYLVTVFDNAADTIKCYVNGIQDGATVTATQNPTVNSAQGVRIGTTINQTPPFYPFTGFMDELAYRNVVWTATDIATDYANGLGTACAAGGGLVVCYKFDEMGGTTGAEVVSTPTNDVTLTNFASPATTKSGWQPQSGSTTTAKLGARSLSMDGKNDYLEVRGANIFATGSTARTIEAWVYPRSSTIRGTIAAYGNSETANQFFEVGINGWDAADNGKVVVYTNGNAVKSATSLTQNAWNWVAVTLDGTGTTLATATSIYISSATADCSPGGTPCAAAAGLPTNGTINTVTTATGFEDLYIGRRGGPLADCLPNLLGCAALDGTDDSFQRADSGVNGDYEAADQTIMGWFNLADCATNDRGLFSKGASYRAFFPTGANYCQLQLVGTTSAFNADVMITPGQWYHFAAVFKSGTGGFQRLYVNGQYAGEVRSGGTPVAFTRSDNANLFLLGNTTASNVTFKGLMDNWKYYTTALSLEEVINDYNLGYGRECAGDETNLFSCWHLNGDATDVTSGARTLTVNGTPPSPATESSGWVATSTFPGYLDEVAVWGIALTGATTPTLATRYNTGSGAELAGTESNLKAVWHFNDAPGTAVDLAHGTSYAQPVRHPTPQDSVVPSDSNACTTRAAPCLTWAGVLSKINPLFRGNSTIYVASGIAPEIVTMDGWNRSGSYTITIQGTYNVTPNHFDHAATVAGVVDSATASFPKDARSVLTDANPTTGTLQRDLSGYVLYMPSQSATSGYCSDANYNWYPIERRQGWQSISVVTVWHMCGSPSSTLSYQIFNPRHGSIINAGLRGSTDYAISLKNSSGIAVKNLYAEQAAFGIYVSSSSLESVIASGASATIYGMNAVNSSSIKLVNAGNWSDNWGYTGFRAVQGTHIQYYFGNLMARNYAVGMENLYESSFGAIYENLALHNKTYGGFDFEASPLVTYNFAWSRGEGNRYGLIVSLLGMNFLGPANFSDNWSYGVFMAQRSEIEANVTISGFSVTDIMSERNGSWGLYIQAPDNDCPTCASWTYTDNGWLYNAGAAQDYGYSGHANPGTVLSVTGSPAANDYDIKLGETIYFSTVPATTFTGFKHGIEGRRLHLIWDDADAISLAHASASSATINRIGTSTGGTLTSTGAGFATLVYASGAWRVVSWEP